MHQLSTYIEYTLMTRHYAFVPGIGGFLLREVDASYSNHIYTPSHREVHFNRFLTKDDGMLANAYMEADNITYDEALSQIQIEVAQILATLNKKKSFKLGNLGTLTYDSDHHLTIKQAKQYPLDPECYGLYNLNIRPWKELEDKKSNSSNEKRADVISIPTYWLQRTAAIIILLLCVLFNVNYDKDVNMYDYASVFDAEIIFDTFAPNTQTSQSWDETWENEKTLSEIEANATINSEEIVNDEQPVAEILPEETAVASENKNNLEATVTPKPATVAPSKLYYIIIASCTSAKEAENAVNNRKKDGYENIGILEKDGRFRLYLKSFTDRTEGEKYLQEVRTTTPFQNAWLLPVRQESLLSFNFKNFDNDQLPMELSHPHKRTERDQGWINT